MFVDESKTNGLLMAAIMCPAAEVNEHRRTMAGLLMPRERRIHFTKESPARRRKILAVIGEIGLAARLYQAERNGIAARRHGCSDTLQYELLAAHADPMLWTPDAVAWSWVKGGEWRDFVALYSTVVRV